MKTFKKYYEIPAEPEEVYLALINEQAIRLWTGDEVEMKAEEQSEFSMWGGSIVGKNISFDYGKKIVQEWYFGDQQEKSIVTIKLHPHKKGTSFELIHSNIPEEEYAGIAEGWDGVYLASLTDFFKED
ncbi:SRPBCC domain-containing protein [Olivibacter domesticus]|uniref:SRPBCC domain-containing protein n=1 Tax=Olivibacter domesticus TaxID=407022 RepID=UPI000B820E99|nr:SRPBCC domain-containing protein [Olivibacter domesticus]